MGRPEIQVFKVILNIGELYEKREIWFTAGIYFSLSRMCDWNWKRMEIPIYVRRVWRRDLYYDISFVSSDFRNTCTCM